MKVSREEKVSEAISRMKSLNIFGETIEQFAKDGKVSRSEPPFGAFYWVEGEDLDRIRKFEEGNDAVVYLVVRSYTTIGEMDSYLYVSDHKEEWEDDRESLKIGESLAYVYNYDAPDCSELGWIGLEHTMSAGLRRSW